MFHPEKLNPTNHINAVKLSVSYQFHRLNCVSAVSWKNFYGICFPTNKSLKAREPKTISTTVWTHWHFRHTSANKILLWKHRRLQDSKRENFTKVAHKYSSEPKQNSWTQKLTLLEYSRVCNAIITYFICVCCFSYISIPEPSIHLVQQPGISPFFPEVGYANSANNFA